MYPSWNKGVDTHNVVVCEQQQVMKNSCTGDASGGGVKSVRHGSIPKAKMSERALHTNEVASYAGLVVIWMGH